LITVLVGSSPLSFLRLLKSVDNWAKNSGEKVVVQSGHTPTEFLTSIECHSFVDHKQIIDWLKESHILITHGGYGSMSDCIGVGKPTIACPRLLDFNETKADQIELVKDLSRQGLIYYLEELNNLGELIESIKKNPNKEQYSVKRSEIPKILADFCNEKLNRSH